MREGVEEGTVVGVGVRVGLAVGALVTVRVGVGVFEGLVVGVGVLGGLVGVGVTDGGFFRILSTASCPSRSLSC